jgi:hypothetical protein
VVSLLRGKQFYYDEVVVTPVSKTIVPNGRSLTSANGDSAPVAGAADRSGQPASG